MLDLLSITVILPLLGAGAISLPSLIFTKLDVERGRLWTAAAALATAVLTSATVVALRGASAGTPMIPSPESALLAGSVIKFRAEPALWPLAAGLSLVTCFFLLAALGRQPDASPYLAAISLVLLGVGLAALWSANPLTTIVSWALYDLFFFLGRITAGVRRDQAIRSLSIGTVAVLLLWAGVLVAGHGTGSVQWSLMPAGGAKMTFWMLAGLLRLGVYPFHLAVPGGAGRFSPPATALFLSPVIGWGLWAQLALVEDGILPVSSWVMVPALLTLMAGGFLGWTARSARGASAWIGMGANGAVLLSVVLASLFGRSQELVEGLVLWILALGVTGWMLGVTILCLGGRLALPDALERRALPRTISSLVGAFSLIGAPITLGFVTQSYLVTELPRLAQRSWIVGFFAGQTFLIVAVARWLFPLTQPGGRAVSPFAQRVSTAGIMAPALSLVLAALVPNLLLPGSSGPSLRRLFAGPGRDGWLLWAGPLLLGGAIAWQGVRLRPGIALWLDALHDVVRLNWAYDLLIGAFEQGLAVVQSADDILGGRGALLWSFVILLLVVLAWRAG